MNKTFFALIITSAVLLPALAFAQSDLSQYKNKARLLLVFAPTKADPRWQKQNALLVGSGAAFGERDLVRLDTLETGGAGGAALRARFRVKRGQFRVLLIGKDGHVASGGPTPISLETLTAQIDRMPMRREEVKQKEEKQKEEKQKEMRRRGQ